MIRIRSCIVWGLLASCAPISSGPPPIGLPDGIKQEVGASSTLGAQITCDAPDCDLSIETIFPEQNFWYRRSVGTYSEVQVMGGGFLSGGVIPYWGLGYRRYLPAEENRPEIALDIKMGGVYFVEVGMPISLQVEDKAVWFTTQPSFGFNPFGSLHIPVGVSWAPKDKFRLSTTLGTRFVGENPVLLYWNGGFSFPF